MKNTILKIVVILLLAVFLLSACMIDSEGMIGTIMLAVCAMSVGLLALIGWSNRKYLRRFSA